MIRFSLTNSSSASSSPRKSLRFQFFVMQADFEMYLFVWWWRWGVEIGDEFKDEHITGSLSSSKRGSSRTSFVTWVKLQVKFLISKYLICGSAGRRPRWIRTRIRREGSSPSIMKLVHILLILGSDSGIGTVVVQSWFSASSWWLCRPLYFSSSSEMKVANLDRFTLHVRRRKCCNSASQVLQTDLQKWKFFSSTNKNVALCNFILPAFLLMPKW